MLVLGHAGITLGAGVLLNSALIKSGYAPFKGQPPQSSEKLSWLSSLGSRIDIRILMMGSLLPDIIDKPVGQLLLRNTLNNGRIFSHTLLFLLIITLIGIYLYRTKRRNWLLVLSAGTLAHLVFDEMWLTPRTLFWPLFGFTFQRLEDLTYWLQGIWYRLFHAPSVYIPELIGAVILLWFTLALVKRKRLSSFIIRGRV